MSMLSRRLQILIDEDRYRRVSGLARERGVSVAEVVREAIDRYTPTAPGRTQRAADAVLSARPMPVPDIEELKRELDELRGRRG